MKTPKYIAFLLYLLFHCIKWDKNINLAKPAKLDKSKAINYYNLHGSINWKIVKTKNSKSYQIDYTNELEETDIQITELADKFTLLSPIITGRDKVNKIFAEPFQNIITNFHNDILNTDEIYLIGYSFLDNHINAVLRKSIEKNPNIKMVVVNPGLHIPDFTKFIFDDLLNSFDKKDKKTIINPINNCYEIEGSRIRFFYQKFADFINNPHNSIKLINNELSLFEKIKQRFE